MASPPHAQGGRPAPDTVRRRNRATTVVSLTVIGVNAVAVAAVLVWAAIAARTTAPQQGEDWSGLFILIAVGFLLFTILVSLGIGIVVAVARMSKPTWPVPASSGRAVIAGLRAAAWGLCATLPLPLLYLVRWIIDAVQR